MQELSVFIANHMGLTYAFATVLILLMIVEFLRNKQNNSRIDPAQAVHLINRESAAVIDLRASEDYRKGHIVNAHSMPASDLNTNSKKLEKFKNKPIILVCTRGLETQKTAALLRKQGYNVYALAGGITAWTQANLPLTKE